ncbi:MAG: hypothetical protein GY793_07630 [Proteobacteria bacterium]|nr:hypothetical protein [Pseudomonadota bacterium]
MVETFMNMPLAMQIFLIVAMIIGLLVMYRFRKLVTVIAAGAIAIFIALTRKKDK